MRSADELRRFYETELLPILQTFEDRRLAALGNASNARNHALLIGLPLTCILAFIFLPVAIGTGMVTLLIAGIAYRRATRGYCADYKLTVMGKLIAFLDPSLQFSPAACVPRAEYDASRLFPAAIDSYRGEDLVSGKIGATALAFSELTTQYTTTTTTTDSNGNIQTQTQTYTVFQGLFFIADFNKHFSGQTFVRTDVAEQLFGKFGQALQGLGFGPATLVKLEDPEFEQLFVVHSSDQIEARYILSNSLMQRITRYRRKTQRALQLSFVGDKVYIAIPNSTNLFEADINRPAHDYAPIAQYYSDLMLAIGIVEELNLNTRLWSKR